MRPQQQNRRMRGRNGGGGNNNNNNNNRRGPNPLNRNYESNGPDVKIRGSAQQIAEKYATLARDAMSSGDRVMAENYLQHAEHYNRIIAAAQAQMPMQNVQQNRDEFDDDLDDERDEFEGSGNPSDSPAASGHGSGPQPVIEGMPAEVALTGEAGGRDGGNREGRDGNGGNRHNRDRRHNGYQNGQRGNGQEAPRREAGPQAEGQAEPREEAAPAADLSPAGIVAQAAQEETAGEGAQPRRGRRPRRPHVAGQGEDASGDVPAAADAGEAPAPVEG